MSINVRERGTVGCAYYVAREEKLYCMEDVKLGGAEIVQACKYTTSLDISKTSSLISPSESVYQSDSHSHSIQRR